MEDRIFTELAELRADNKQDNKQITDRIIEMVQDVSTWHAESSANNQTIIAQLAQLTIKVEKQEEINGKRDITCALHNMTEGQIQSRLVQIETETNAQLEKMKYVVTKNSRILTMVRGGYIAVAAISSIVSGILLAVYHLVQVSHAFISGGTHTP